MKLPLTPIRCLYRGVDLYGRKIGVVSGPERYTYEQFGERCERLAAGLQAEGVQRGDRVAFLSFNNNQLLEGCFRGGVSSARNCAHSMKMRSRSSFTPAAALALPRA